MKSVITLPKKPNLSARHCRHLAAIALWMSATCSATPAYAQNVPVSPLVWTTVTPETQAEPPSAAPSPATDNTSQVQPRAATSIALPPSRYNTLINKVAQEFKLDTHLLHAIVETESGYRANAISPKGATGLMQVMPATGHRFGFHNLREPVANLRAGATYLKWLLDEFNNNSELAVAAYNAGEGAVRKYGQQVPPYRETQAYVHRVLARAARNRGNEASLQATAPSAIDTQAATPASIRITARLDRSTSSTFPSNRSRTPTLSTLASFGKLAGLLLSEPSSASPVR